jgi:hypothetical protein
MRHEWSGIVTGEDIPLCPHGREWELFTFAGDRINILLGQALESILGCGVSGDSLSLRIKSTSATPMNVDVIIQAIDIMRTDDYFSPERILSLAEGLPPSHWSKFQPLLPKELEARFLAEKLFDTQGLQDWLKDRQKVRLYKVESEK